MPQKIQLEKKIYERLGSIDRDIQNLVLTNYRVMSMLVPKARPTKKERKAIEDALKEKRWASEKELFRVLRK